MHLLIVEDNEQLAQCLALELENEGFITETASNGAECLQRLQPDRTGKHHVAAIDVLILDWDLPDFSGLEIVKRLRHSGHDIPTLMLTGRDRLDDRVSALNLGLDDYLIKPFSFDELVARIRSIARRRSNDIPPGSKHENPLSRREQEVLNLIAAGQSNAEIAEALFLSPETIKSHMKTMLVKLQAKDRTHALVIALQQGFVRVPSPRSQDHQTD
jgi:DNA-binding NarL/FixJ family response regulator